MKVYYTVTAYYANLEPQSIELEATVKQWRGAHELNVKTALNTLSTRDVLERYEVAVTATAQDA